jgi:hypothetical protein
MTADTVWAREACREAIGQQSVFTPWLFENTSASTTAVQESYLRPIQECDLVIWLAEASTTPPVRLEIETALATARPILVFRIDTNPSDAETESLLAQVGTKWTFVVDAVDLKAKLEAALVDELRRAWRARRDFNRPALIAALQQQSRNRCMLRWQAVGVDDKVAQALADDPSIGRSIALDAGRFTVLVGELGLGKSLAAERFYQNSLVSALEDATKEIPLFIEAKKLQGRITDRVVQEWGHRPQPSATFVAILDGLDEAAPERRLELAREARSVALDYPNSTVLVTTRALADLGDEFSGQSTAIEPLARKEVYELIARVAGREVQDHEYWDYPDSFHEALERPLFAILVALSHLDSNHYRLPTGRLLAELVKRSLGRVNLREEGSHPILFKLARQTIEKGGAPVPIAEVGSLTDVAPLLRSRLVVEDKDRLAFPLAIICEWFAARDIEARGVDIENIVGDSRRLERWRVPITLCVTEGSEETVDRVMGPLARLRPAVAAEVLHETFHLWAPSSEADSEIDWKQLKDDLRRHHWN